MWIYINFWDYFLAALFVCLLYFIVKKISLKYYLNDPFLKKKLIQGFWAKMFGAIAYAVFIQYYYGGGDSFRYFGYGNVMYDAIVKDISNIKFLFLPSDFFLNYCESLLEINEFSPANAILKSEANTMVIRLSCLLDFICFKRFLLVSLIFSILSYIGIWQMFKLFYKIFYHYKKEISFSFLFLPSFCFWGSGILKETICLMALGLLIKFSYDLIFLKKYKLSSIIIAFLMIFLIYFTKSYILASFIIALVFWIISFYIKKIKNNFFKGVLIFLIFGFTVFSLSFISIDTEAQKEEILNNVEFYSNTYRDIAEESGSLAYTNMEIDPSVSGIIKGTPKVLLTIFFRPYIWEARSIILFISMIESCFFLIMFFKGLFRGNFFGFFKKIFISPPLVFCLVLSLSMGLIVGFTTFNFGSIIRYKIPCMPFFCLMLLIINSSYKSKGINNHSFNN
jgi:hypothetical protein